MTFCVVFKLCLLLVGPSTYQMGTGGSPPSSAVKE